MPGGRIQIVHGLRRDALSVGDGVVGWRLMGANNRECARSTRRWVDVDGARQGAADLRGRLGRGVLSTLVDPNSGQWSWRLQVDGVVEVVSSRSYQRRRESESNATLSLALLATAVVLDGVLEGQRPDRPSVLTCASPRVHRVSTPCP